MTARPHLVLDGAELAADAVGARRIVLYVGAEHRAAIDALDRALEERRCRARGRLADPHRARRRAALLHRGRGVRRRPLRERRRCPADLDPAAAVRARRRRPSDARAERREPRPRGADRPFGDGWFREAGRGETRGPACSPSVARRTPASSSSRSARRSPRSPTIAGAAAAPRRPVLLGGYFGGWVAGARGLGRAPRPVDLRRAGSRVRLRRRRVPRRRRCGVRATARILDFMAGSSAAQCGPCVFGLRAIADATARLADGRPERDDLGRI